ncbi:helix-turn-helix transcriptional regulator [Christensenellaceae bacterium OttesenSCG-928-M15]|nr:helix-turn-helix transcriptional regulator [Christensenellaceae bacterium OttesenSCG-928-M15]
MYQRLAKALAVQFGDNCEVVVHDLTKADHSIVAIENGHVSNRKIGDGPSHIVLDAMKKGNGDLVDQLGYLAKTHDGRIVKSSTVYIRDDNNKVVGVFSINYDLTGLMMAESAIKSIINHQDSEKAERIPQNVNDLLDDLIDQSVATVGKPVALMTKEDKIRAIQFLNNSGAFLITKSGDKVSKHFGISKYTLYSYIDAKN